MAEQGPKNQEKNQQDQPPTPDQMSFAARILGVRNDATREEIAKAYRDAAKQFHPDIGGNRQSFQEAAEAFALLEKAIESGVWEERDLEEENKFKRYWAAAENMAKEAASKVAEKYNNIEFKKWTKNKYVWAAVTFVGLSAGLAALTKPEKEKTFSQQPAIESRIEPIADRPSVPVPQKIKPKNLENDLVPEEIEAPEEPAPEEPAPEEPASEEPAPEEPAPEEPAPEEVSEEKKPELAPEKIEQAEADVEVETGPVIDKQVEINIEANLEKYTKGQAHSEGNGAFIVDLGSRGCYRLTPDDIKMLGEIKDKYSQILESKRGSFNLNGLRQGLIKKAGEEMIQVIRKCEKVEEDQVEEVIQRAKKMQKQADKVRGETETEENNIGSIRGGKKDYFETIKNRAKTAKEKALDKINKKSKHHHIGNYGRKY